MHVFKDPADEVQSRQHCLRIRSSLLATTAA
jgi:hypothetical protein